MPKAKAKEQDSGMVAIPANLDSLYTVIPVKVRLEGLTGILMNRMTDETMQSIQKGTRKSGGYSKTPREEAELVAYRNEDGVLYVQGVAIQRMLQERGRWHTVQGSKGKNVANLVPGGTRVTERIVIQVPKLVRGVWDQATWTDATDFEVDTRTVVNPSTRKRNVRSRPRIDNWRVEFTLDVFPYFLDPPVVRMLLMEGGMATGLGDYRPQCSGQYGKFVVGLWEPQVPRPVEAMPTFQAAAK